MTISKFLTRNEAATYLKVSVGTVRNLCRAGELRGHTFGNRWRFSEADLLDYANRNSRGR